jgi:hypothetical protein
MNLGDKDPGFVDGTMITRIRRIRRVGDADISTYDRDRRKIDGDETISRMIAYG